MWYLNRIWNRLPKSLPDIGQYREHYSYSQLALIFVASVVSGIVFLGIWAGVIWTEYEIARYLATTTNVPWGILLWPLLISILMTLIIGLVVVNIVLSYLANHLMTPDHVRS